MDCEALAYGASFAAADERHCVVGDAVLSTGIDVRVPYECKAGEQDQKDQ